MAVCSSFTKQPVSLSTVTRAPALVRMVTVLLFLAVIVAEVFAVAVARLSSVAEMLSCWHVMADASSELAEVSEASMERALPDKRTEERVEATILTLAARAEMDIC